jgi:hypothetical protein
VPGLTAANPNSSLGVVSLRSRMMNFPPSHTLIQALKRMPFPSSLRSSSRSSLRVVELQSDQYRNVSVGHRSPIRRHLGNSSFIPDRRIRSGTPYNRADSGRRTPARQPRRRLNKLKRGADADFAIRMRNDSVGLDPGSYRVKTCISRRLRRRRIADSGQAFKEGLDAVGWFPRRRCCWGL